MRLALAWRATTPAPVACCSRLEFSTPAVPGLQVRPDCPTLPILLHRARRHRLRRREGPLRAAMVSPLCVPHCAAEGQAAVRGCMDWPTAGMLQLMPWCKRSCHVASGGRLQSCMRSRHCLPASLRPAVTGWQRQSLPPTWPILAGTGSPATRAPRQARQTSFAPKSLRTVGSVAMCIPKVRAQLGSGLLPCRSKRS